MPKSAQKGLSDHIKEGESSIFVSDHDYAGQMSCNVQVGNEELSSIAGNST